MPPVLANLSLVPGNLGTLLDSGSLLTSAQVARRLGLCRESVNRATRRGELVPLLQLPGPNGAYLFDEAAVIAWRSPGDRLPGL